MFKNENINLRKLTINDAELYHSWRNDTDVMKSTSPQLDLYSREETQDFIEMITSSPNAKSYIIQDDGTDIGITSLVNIDYKNGSAECIIDIGNKEYWGRGVGSKAMSLLMNYAFNELNLHRLYLQVFDFNAGAIKLYKRLGFIEEGRSREALYRDGKYHDIISMSILKSEYK